MKKCHIFILCIVMAVCFWGCTLRNPEEATVPSSVESYRVPEISSPLEIDRTEQIGDKTVIIHATVAPVEEEKLFTAVLEPNISAWAALGKELLPYYTQEIDSAAQSGSMAISVIEDERLWLKFSLEEYPVGGMSFLDCEKDLNGSDLDSDRSYSIPH